MDSGVAASISLIVFWIFTGLVIWFYTDRRQKRARRKAEIERLMNEWLQLQRKQGTEPELILDQAPFKRVEIEAMIRNKV